MTSTDIVDETAAVAERLRRDAYAPHFTSVGAANLMIEAADLIERLSRERDTVIEECIAVVGKPRTIDAMRGDVAVPDCAQDIIADLRALQGQPRERGTGVPEGWQLVPKEPTDGMLQNFEDEYWMHFATTPPNPWTVGEKLYRAMLSSAPQPPQTGVPEGEPTRDMAEAGRDWAQREWRASGDPKGYLDFYLGVFRAMLSAAPQPPSVSDQAGDLPPFESAGLRGAKLVAERELGIATKDDLGESIFPRGLKPCPFCGEPASMIPSSDHSTAYEVSCSNASCRISPSVWNEIGAQAAAEWNRRPSFSPVTSITVEVTRLSAELVEARKALARTERNRDMWKGQCERQAERLTAINSLPEPCVESLSPLCQQQIDEHGVLVAVSRQAADEIYGALKVARAALSPKKDTDNGNG